MLSLLVRSAEFCFYAVLLRFVDWASALPRETEPDAMRLYRENLALKAQLHALQIHVATMNHAAQKMPRIPLRMRAAQVFAYLLTRGRDQFQRYRLTDSLQTIQRWATVFRSLSVKRRGGAHGGRPETDAVVVELVLTLKRENPIWGKRRIREALQRLGVKVSEPTIKNILAEHGLGPRPRTPEVKEILKTSVRDALWALDYFAVRVAKGKYVQVLLIIDIATRELMDLRVHDGWDVDAVSTVRMLNRVVTTEGRTPAGIVHDHGSTFFGHFKRQMRVMEIPQHVTAVRSPWLNAFAERAIYSVRREPLSHVVAKDARELQWYLDEYRRWANHARPHNGLDGLAPKDVGKPTAPVLQLDELRRRRLERKRFAHGLLSGFALTHERAAA